MKQVGCCSSNSDEEHAGVFTHPGTASPEELHPAVSYQLHCQILRVFVTTTLPKFEKLLLNQPLTDARDNPVPLAHQLNCKME